MQAMTLGRMLALEEAGTNLAYADTDSLNSHPILREIAELTGMKGEQARLTRQDIDFLMTSQGEQYAELQDRFRSYLEDQKNNQKVIVTIDGYEVTSHLTRIQQEQHRMPSKNPSGHTSAPGTHRGALSSSR